jgi:hypothetical protein
MSTKSSPATAVSSAAAPPGRLAVLTGLAVAAASIPLPVVPTRLLARIRGAIAHDTVARHGLSLTTDARLILAEPAADRPVVRRAAEAVALELLRRLRGVGVLAAAGRALEVYALGHLLDRYLATARPTGAARIHAEEARRIRELIHRAVMRTLSPSLNPSVVVLPAGAEDLRDELTRWTDTLLLAGAAAPGYLERRLDAAFDDVVKSESNG